MVPIEWDNQNGAAHSALPVPAVLPIDLCTMSSRDFNVWFRQQRLRLVHVGLDIVGVEKIDELFWRLQLE